MRKKCAAYTTDSGRECWMLAGSFNKAPNCPKLKQHFKDCWECPWFLKMNPSFKDEPASSREELFSSLWRSGETLGSY
ncbi:hypothetical protein KKC32_03980 [Patescibacteria group bacterium]|nr:hypothetical protein [Patescibacteria group bacterium]